MLEHEQAGLPALLNFKSEMILDARQFERSANYALLRITEAGDKGWDDCVDPAKSPVIVIDPRAGHGPGIGGFKRDSEVGIALHVGHAVYFVIFFAEPCPGQTLGDVLAALRGFVEHVAKLHPGHPPVLYGNCQAGWAATLVAAHCGDLTGPVILNGSPLSYWAGEPGVNPMRVTAGLVGGVWLTAELPVDDRFYEKYHAPYAVIHRADMLNVIYEACKRSSLIRLAPQKVVGFEETPSCVTVRTDSGETFSGAALIGCDGLWSTVGRFVVGDGKPVVSGHVAYRAVVPTAEWPKEYRINRMVLWAGEKTHLVHYPLRRGEVFNLVGVFHSNRYEEGWDTYGDPDELHARFADKCEPVRALLKKVNAWKMWVLCDRPPIKEWSKSTVTLLGDAAHPMLQYLAQGANMALEDAVCLAEQAAAHGGDYATAFKRYQEIRYLRTARLQLMARVFGEVYHASGVNRELRNQVIGEWTAQGGVDMSWLYGHQPGLPRVETVAVPKQTLPY